MGGLIINNLAKNYFAAWIANFGVVPLFLLAAFLFAPAFFFFLNLLFVVTHVLETIRQLLFRYRSNQSLIMNFKPSFLPSNVLCVKGIFLSYCIISSLSGLNAQETSHDIVLSKGQSTEITLEKLEKFNVGNPEVIKYHFNEKSKKLLMRGLQIGHTEIIVWKNDKSRQSYEVFVVSKTQEAKLLQLAQMAFSLGLSSKIEIPNIKIYGTLKTFENYISYKKRQEQNKDTIIDVAVLDKSVKNKIFANIYKAFFEDYKESIKCSEEFSQITCSYPENDAPSEELKKQLSDKYKVKFILRNNQQLNKNYQLRIKLIQLEQLDGEDIRLGLEQISGSLGDFLTIPLEKIVQKNQLLLSQKKVKVSTLAEPQTLIRPQTPAELQIGADIPFKSTNSSNVQSTDWKFAGLKIKVAIENFNDKIKINYETELTQPTTDQNGMSSVNGNKEKSSVVIALQSATKIFQISLRTEGNSTDQMPYLSRIPILGELFKSKSTQSNFKTITGIIEVTENDE